MYMTIAVEINYKMYFLDSTVTDLDFMLQATVYWNLKPQDLQRNFSTFQCVSTDLRETK